MGIVIDGKKIIGLTHNGKKVLGIAHSGSLIWQYLVATKLWTSATDSYLIDNLQLDDKGLLYMVDSQSINRIGKNDGTIYANRVDSGGICGDLTFNTAQNKLNYVGKTAYLNSNNYNDLTGAGAGQKGYQDYPTDVISSLYKNNNYDSIIAACQSNWIDIIDSSKTTYNQVKTWTPSLSNPLYLQALDGFGTNSNFTAGDFLAYSSTGAKAYNASSSTALDLEGTQSSRLVSSTKVSYAPIGYDINKVNYYLSNHGNYYTLFLATKSNSIVNLIHLTYGVPQSGATIEALVVDYDAYNNLISNVTKSTDGSNSSASLVDVPSKFTSYSSEKDSSGNSHIYALTYNANSDWTKINKEKLIDLDAGYNVQKMVKSGNMLYVGENKTNFISTPWKFTADNVVYSVAVDSSGNVYAGTINYSVYKLDSTGKQLWKFTADSYVESVAVDSSGNVYAGTMNSSVYKLDSTGKQVWKFTADSSANSVAVDNNGNVYAGTYSSSSVYKLDSTGKQLWKFTADSYARSVAVDNNGNVYASTNAHSVYKLDSTGKQLWEFTADNVAYSVAVDNNGNVYAGTNGHSVYKLDSTGKQLWKFIADNVVYSVAVDNNGNVYAGTNNSSVYKLDSTGKQLWEFNADSSVYSVAVDNDGNVYAGTYSTSVYKLTPAGSDTATYTDAQSQVEAYQIDKLTFSNLTSAVDLSTNDSSGNQYQPNSIAVSASNFAVASNPTSANRTLLRSMCVDGNIYTDQSNTTGAQGVCGVPYDNTGSFISEAGRLSYRKYSDFGTLVQYYSNSAIKGTDPMVGYISNNLKNSTAIDWTSNGNLYMQNSTGWNGNYASGYTDNNGNIALAPIKGARLAYLIHPSTADIKVFDTNSLSVTNTLPQYHLSSVTNGTSNVIAVSVDGTICYGTKNKDAQTLFFENPNTGTLFTDRTFNSECYLLDIASDSNNNFAVLYYNSTSKQVIIDWYTSKGRYISTNTFSQTYNSLPYGKIEIDPQNGNVGLIMGNNYSMWTFTGVGNTNSKPKYLDVGTSLYNGIPSNGLLLEGDSGQSVSSLTNPLGINSDRITLLHSIDECPNGIKITFGDSEYYNYGGNGYELQSKEDISISKGSTSGSGILKSNSGYYTSVIVTINSDNILQFATHNYMSGIGSTYAEQTGTYDGINNMFFAIASITAY